MLPIAPRLVYLYLLFNGEKINTHTGGKQKKGKKNGTKTTAKNKKKGRKTGGGQQEKKQEKITGKITSC